MKKLQLGLLVIGLIFASQVNAQDLSSEKYAKAFAKIDANTDGVILLEELQSIKSKKASKKGKEAKDQAKRFGRMDGDGDGKVTLEEYKTFRVKMEKKKKKKKAKKEKISGE